MGQMIRVPLGALQTETTADENPPSAAAPIRVSLEELTAAPDFQSSNATDASGVATVDPNTLGTFASHVGAQVNPVTAVKTISNASPFPKAMGGGGVPIPKALGGSGMDAGLVQTIKGIGTAQEEPLHRAKASYAQGDVGGAAIHFLNYLLPLVGPVLDKSGTDMRAGKYAAGAGDAVGLGLAMFGPDAAINALPARGVKIGPALPQNPNAAEAAAVQFGQQHRVPIDAATASGNKFVRGVQTLADESLGGSQIGQRAKAAQATALQRVGGELADRAYPTVATTEQAGEGVATALKSKIQAHDALANASYDRLRMIEADPRQTRLVQVGTKAGPTGQTVPVMEPVALPVDLRPFRASMTPVYQQLLRESELVPLQGGKARALTALDRLMQGADHAPLSVVDGALGDIKSMARGAEMPELRTQGQGVAAAAVKELDDAVRKTAVRAGGDTFLALQRGRAATTAKYTTADAMGLLRAEPVQVYRQLTAPGDSSVGLLKTLSKETPHAVPKVARAYLDQLLDVATSEGSFDRAAKLQAEWSKLGDETKKVLFPHAGQTQALDNFFLLAKKLADHPNPSGSALTLWKGGELTALVTNPLVGVPYSLGTTGLSKLLHSPAGVRALTRGMEVSLPGSKASAAMKAAVAGQITAAARAAGVRTALPLAAGTEDPP